MSEQKAERDAVEDRNLPCMATGETDVDGAVLPVACDLWLGHDRSHWDETVFAFWGREHGGPRVRHPARPRRPQAAPMTGELVACAACAERPEAVEPIEVGWYAYSGGGQTMVFHLRETGQWSVHVDNGSAADCGWGYIEQALGVWSLVPLVPRTDETWDPVTGGLPAAIEALANQWTSATCQTDGAPCSWHRVSAECAAELRAVLDRARPTPTTEGN